MHSAVILKTSSHLQNLSQSYPNGSNLYHPCFIPVVQFPVTESHYFSIFHILLLISLLGWASIFVSCVFTLYYLAYMKYILHLFSEEENLANFFFYTGMFKCLNSTSYLSERLTL